MGRRVRVKPEEPQTGDKNGRKAVLLLKDGTLFEGEGFGAAGTTAGEVVFNTGMTGYQEILTDPSYKGQMVILTYPHIGNYGINPEDAESLKPQVEGLIVRELCREPSNHRSRLSLDAYLKEHRICAIQGIDTRALTRCIREKGSMMGILSTEELSLEELGRRLGEHPGIEGRDFVRYVTIGEEKLWKPAADRVGDYEKPDSPDPGRFR